MTAYATIDSPIGEILLTADGGALSRLYMAPFALDPAWRRDDAALAEPARQLAEYFAGERTEFDLPLAPHGSDFQRRVWDEIARVPYGETISYAELASRAGAPGHARAAGAATGRNPVGVVIPCHRIVGSDGSLTGYAGGLERKASLLQLEKALATTEGLWA